MSDRTLSLHRPIVWLDLETTGLDKRRDRIVEIATLKEWPDGRTEQRERRVNPGMPIPPEATAIHGITDDDVRDEPAFSQLAKSFAEFLEGADLGGFGITRFDAPLLTAEFKRAGVPFSLEGRALLDAQIIYHAREPRDLAAACRHYLEREHDGAHAALADVTACRDVFLAQLRRYPDLPLEPAELEALHRNPEWVDREGKLLRRGGEVTLNFGQHRGRTLRELAEREPDYLRWMLGSDFSDEVVHEIRQALEGKASAPHPS